MNLSIESKLNTCNLLYYLASHSTFTSFTPSQSETVTAERNCLDSECNKSAEKVGDLHLQLEEMEQGLETITESSYLQVVEILRAAIGLKPNAGGAIKTEIKRALDLLSPKTPTKK